MQMFLQLSTMSCWMIFDLSTDAMNGFGWLMMSFSDVHSVSCPESTFHFCSFVHICHKWCHTLQFSSRRGQGRVFRVPSRIQLTGFSLTQNTWQSTITHLPHPKAGPPAPRQVFWHLKFSSSHTDVFIAWPAEHLWSSPTSTPPHVLRVPRHASH